jgi:hypothetical protein
VRALFDGLQRERAGVDGGGRPELDPEAAVVGAVLVAAGDVGAREAGCDPLHVDERGPDLVQRCGDLK